MVLMGQAAYAPRENSESPTSSVDCGAVHIILKVGGESIYASYDEYLS